MKFLFVYLFLSMAYCVKGQFPVLPDVSISFKQEVIEEDDGFIVFIKLVNNSKNPLYISPRPVISSFVGDFGDIKIRIERLDSSCFQLLDIAEDPWGVKFVEYTKELKMNDSITHRVDIRNYGFIKKGVYRVKVYYSYLTNGEILTIESQWKFIDVIKYFHLKKPTLFREESNK